MFLIINVVQFKGLITKIYFSNVKIYHSSALVKIDDEEDKKKILIKNTKKNNFSTIDNIDVVSLNYCFIPNNEIGKILGLEGFFNKEKNRKHHETFIYICLL